MSDSVARNRAWWDRSSDEYQGRHGEFIGKGGTASSSARPIRAGACGRFRSRPFAEGQALRRLAPGHGGRIGIRPTRNQCRVASRPAAAGPAASDVCPDASSRRARPSAEAAIGALTFGDLPYRVVPEAARLLRPGGLLAFAHTSPLFNVCWEVGADSVGTELRAPYFGMYRWEDGPGEAVDYNLPHGEWIRLFHEHGLQVESLLEIQPPEGAPSTYRSEAETEWARKWPMEEIWRARKPA